MVVVVVVNLGALQGAQSACEIPLVSTGAQVAPKMAPRTGPVARGGPRDGGSKTPKRVPSRPRGGGDPYAVVTKLGKTCSDP